MIPGDFDRFAKASLGFAHASDLTCVPDDPGIYAWFAPFQSRADQGVEGLLRSLETAHTHSAPLTEREGVIGEHDIRIRRAAPTFDLAASAIASMDNDLAASDLEYLSVLLLILSVLAPPIYVGMTRTGLRSRLQAHLSGAAFADDLPSSQFAARVRAVSGDPGLLRRCVIVYVPLAARLVAGNAERLLEHALHRLMRPSQSVRG